MEKAEDTCLDSWCRVTVGSVQTLMREKRLKRFSQDYFDDIIVDEAHRSTGGDSFENIQKSFPHAAWVGYTGTPMFESTSNSGVLTRDIFGPALHRYTIREAIADGNVLGFKVEFETTLDQEKMKSDYLPKFYRNRYPKWSDADIQRKIENLTVEDIDDTIARLTPVLQLTEEDIERFKSRIKTSRKTERVSIKLNLNESDIARFSEVKFQFPGVNIETQMTRYYPHGELFAHVIGYVGRINDKELKEIDKDAYAGTNLIGKIGVEKSYEHLLHGVPGNESVEADAHGNVLRNLGRKDPVRGNDL